MNTITDRILEQYVLGELPSEKMKDLDQKLEKNHILRKRVDDIRKSNEEILSEYTPADMARVIIRKAQEPEEERKPSRLKRSGLPGWYYFTPFAAAAVILFALVLPINHTGFNSTGQNTFDTYTRMKGTNAKMYIYRKAAGKAELLAPGSKVKKNDLLQIAYQCSGKRYGTIISIDGRGTVTVHMSGNNGKALALECGKKISLSESYQLDNAPYFERFFLISSGSPFMITDILEKAEIFARDTEKASEKLLPAGKDLEQYTILFEKDTEQ